MQIGFIGLGIMGWPMAQNLLRAGFNLTIATRTTGKAERFAKENSSLGSIKAVKTPAEVAAECEIIVTIVTDTPDVEKVVRGEDGIFSTAKPGTIIIDMSTISAIVVQQLAKEAESKNIYFLDAPCSGGEKGAIEGTLTIMVGGNESALERAQPVFNAMGKRITHMGASGNGQYAKMCNQISIAINLLSVSEALTLGAKVGLDLNKLHQALTGGGANSWVLEVLGKKMIDRDFKPAFMISLQQKDIKIVLETANKSHTPLPGTSLVHQLFSSLEAQGCGEDGTQSLIRVLESLAGLK